MRNCELKTGDCVSDYGGICECCGRYVCLACMAKSKKGTWIGLCKRCRKDLAHDDEFIRKYAKRKAGTYSPEKMS